MYAFYFQTNTNREESMEIAKAAYDLPFWNFTIPMKKKVIFLIMRAQHPLEVTIGNVFPITLELFQKILNTAYSFFSVARRILK